MSFIKLALFQVRLYIKNTYFVKFQDMRYSRLQKIIYEEKCKNKEKNISWPGPLVMVVYNKLCKHKKE